MAAWLHGISKDAKSEDIAACELRYSINITIARSADREPCDCPSTIRVSATGKICARCLGEILEEDPNINRGDNQRSYYDEFCPSYN